MQNLMILLGLWVIVESFIAADKMDKGDRLCRMMKYGATCAAGFQGVALGWLNLANWTHAIFLIALGLFLWPTVLYRFRGEYRNRVNDQ